MNKNPIIMITICMNSLSSACESLNTTIQNNE